MHTEKPCSHFWIYTVFLLSLIPLLFCGCGRRTSVPAAAGDRQTEEERREELTQGNVLLSESLLASYAQITDCSIQSDGRTLALTLTMPDIPRSDNALLYLFAFEPYEGCGVSDDFKHRVPVAYTEKSTSCEFRWDYGKDQLFRQFVPALLLDGKYVPLSTGIFISNPESIAANSDSYPQTRSKKGLLVDPQMVGTDLLTDLNLQHAVYNIPLSHITGETTNETFPTITYIYKGNAYRFNGAAVAAYDFLFTYLTDAGMLSTAIILNDWNEDCPELIHPLARDGTADVYYYAFNTAEEEGCRHLEAIASFLTERYSGTEYGLVSSWVIANEINQHKIWNYMNTDDIELYAAEFEKALRIFYTAAKSNYAGAKVYFSVDHDWNNNGNDNSSHFNGRDIVEAVNRIAGEKGNYDWGLAIHPYPEPLTRVNYWTQHYDKTMDAPLLTLMNLSTTTDFMRQEEYLDSNGNVRSITVTELGFSSASGEKLQAAAFAYCYYIIDSNPYVEAFMMNRQTDAPEEMRQGLAFGIYETDHTSKFILDVFQYIDTEQAGDYTDFMLNILGAESIEEALSWAQ